MPFKKLNPKNARAFGFPGLGKMGGMGKAGGVGGGSGLSKLLLLALPLGTLLLGAWMLLGTVASLARRLWRWIITNRWLTALLVASAVWFGTVVWATYNYWEPRQVSLAVDFRSAENYAFMRALKTVAARHYPPIKINLLEIEESTGLLEKGLLQMAVVPANKLVGVPAGGVVRSVAAPTPQSLLLVRSDVDRRLVYVLTQTLFQRGAELASAINDAAISPLATRVQKPDGNYAPLHPGATAFYEKDRTRFIFKYPIFNGLALIGIVLAGAWGLRFGRRSRRKGQVTTATAPEEEVFEAMEEEPWSFSRILMEREQEAAAHETKAAQVPGRGARA